VVQSGSAFGRGNSRAYQALVMPSDKMTFGHFVFYLTFCLLEYTMQIRSANNSCHSATSVANPIIIAFDRNWNELFRKPLSLIEGMAYGVREDYEGGYRGIKTNWCVAKSNDPTIQRICAWATPNNPTE
jgi:hypothetical protein